VREIKADGTSSTHIQQRNTKDGLKPFKFLVINRRDSRRRGDRRYDPYPRRRRSRSKSPPLNYHDIPSNEGVELFPAKVSNGRPNEPRRSSRSRSPGRRRRIEGSHPAFTTILQTASSTEQTRRPSRRIAESDDLFPDKLGNGGRAAMDGPVKVTTQASLSFDPDSSLQNRISTGEEFTIKGAARKSVELFPEKTGLASGTTQSKSLADRIQDGPGQGAVELFPELLRGGGAGRRRRRKAEDHF